MRFTFEPLRSLLPWTSSNGTTARITWKSTMTKKVIPVNINTNLDFDTARHLKFQAGIDKHRNGDRAREFHGELCDEAWQECLDLYSYLEQMEQRDGVDLTLRKAMVKALACDLRKIHEKHLGERL